MSEELAGGAPEAGAADAGAAGAPEGGTPAPEAASETDPFDTGADTFGRSYVEKLRNESAGYRERAKQFEEAFSPYSDDERGVWLDLAKTFAQDPQEAAAWMERIITNVRGGQDPATAAEETAPAETAPAAEETKALTVEDFERMMSERETRAEQAKVIAKVQADVAELAKGDPLAELRILQLASDTTGGDIARAHEMFQAEKQGWIDAFVAGKAADAGAPSPATAGGVPSGEKQIRSMADAEAAMRARLESMGMK